MTYRGHIQNGVAVLDEQVDLPDGTPVRVEVESASTPISGATRPPRAGPRAGALPCSDPADLAGDWPEDESIDDFLALMREPRLMDLVLLDTDVFSMFFRCDPFSPFFPAISFQPTNRSDGRIRNGSHPRCTRLPPPASCRAIVGLAVAESTGSTHGKADLTLHRNETTLTLLRGTTVCITARTTT